MNLKRQCVCEAEVKKEEEEVYEASDTLLKGRAGVTAAQFPIYSDTLDLRGLTASSVHDRI